MLRAIFAQRLLTPATTVDDAVMMIDGGRIAAIGPRETVEVPPGTPQDRYGDAVLAPGLVDIHIHGGAGVDLMRAGKSELDQLRRHLARHGVTSFLATTVTAPWPELLQAVERLGALGLLIHLEGPFLSPVRRGVHPEPDLLAPTPERLAELWERSGGQIRMLTIAPELPGACELITEAVKHGIRVSLGHSDANAEQTRAALAAGARHVTHTFNAMRPMHQRDPGLLGVALADAALSAEIIADGIHVDPMLVALFLRAKAAGKAVLVSDAIAATGMGDGIFHLGPIEVTCSGGCCRSNGALAGSVLTLEQAIRNVRIWTNCGWAEAVRLASENPATLAGWERKGRLDVGMDADIAVFSPQGAVIATYVAGRLVN